MQVLLIFTLIVLVWGRIGGIINKVRTGSSIKTEVTEVKPPNTPMPSPTKEPNKEVKGAATVQVHVSSSSSSQNPDMNTNTDFYVYPSSKVISASSTNLVLETTDDSKVVTDWYKNKIKDQSLNVQSFVTTNTNGQILNKLVATNGKTKIEVDINGHTGATLTISITLF